MAAYVSNLARAERRRLLAIVRAERALWRARMDASGTTRVSPDGCPHCSAQPGEQHVRCDADVPGSFEGSARAVQALDQVLRAMRARGRGR